MVHVRSESSISRFTPADSNSVHNPSSLVGISHGRPWGSKTTAATGAVGSPEFAAGCQLASANAFSLMVWSPANPYQGPFPGSGALTLGIIENFDSPR